MLNVVHKLLSYKGEGGIGKQTFCINGDPLTIGLRGVIHIITPTSDLSVLVHNTSKANGRCITQRVRILDNQSSTSFVTISYKILPGRLTTSRLFNRVGNTFAKTARGGANVFTTTGRKALFLSRINGLGTRMRETLLHTLRRGHCHPMNNGRRVRASVHLMTTAGRSLRGTVTRKHFERSLFRHLGRFPLRMPLLTRYVRSVVPLTRFVLSTTGQRLKEDIGNFSHRMRGQLGTCS